MEGTWTEYQLEHGQFRRHQIGPATFVVLRTPDEWKIAELAPNSQIPETGKRSELKGLKGWTRWEAGQSGLAYSLVPGLPDLPLMATPRAPVFIPPGTEATFYLSLPITVEVMIETGRKKICLGRLPTQPLSKTWHGDRSAGEACYALNTNARRNLDRSFYAEHLVTCPFTIKNTQAGVFEFKELLFDPGSLFLYQAENHLWGSLSKIKPQADMVTAEVKVRETAPEEISELNPSLVRKGLPSPKTQLRKLFQSITH